LIANAIEELLRYEAPSPVNGRWVTRRFEIYGTVVPPDSKILLLNGSANRDPREFDDPDRFDVRRAIKRHITFGYGAHFCLGAALARLEGRVALARTMARFPTCEIDDAELVPVHTSTVRGFSSVPIHLR
jgi:cytochrome P450